MFTFKPKRLRKTAKQVKEDHPESMADYQSPEFVSSDLGKQLAARLEATKESELKEFVDGLSSLERSLYCGLIHHDTQLLQRRVLYGLTLDAGLGDVRHLWTYFEKIFGHPLAEMTAQVLIGLPQAAEQLEHPQLELCRAVADERDGLGKFWLALQQQRRVEEELSNPSTYSAGSRIGVAARRYFYCKGWHGLWQSVSADTFRQYLTRLTQDKIVDAIIQGWRIQKQRGSRDGAHWLKTYLELLGVPGSTLWELLRERSPEAANWYRQLRVRRELHRFFERFPDNERFEFWKKFIPYLYDARGDLTHQRLFLDFGTFGLIEFAETGNAAYVYGAKDFREIRDMNFRRKPTNHSEVKDRNRSITRLTHRGRWQNRFRRKINHYLRQTKRM